MNNCIFMRLRILCWSIVFLSLSGCDDGAFTDGPSPDNKTTIQDFDIGGENAGVIITAGNTAEFTVSWRVISSNPYSVKLAISEDDQFPNGDTEIELLDKECGTDDGTYDCSNSGSVQCIFDMDPFDSVYQIQCDGNTEQSVEDYTNVDDAYDVYFVLYACNAANSNCKLEAIDVKLQL